MVKGNLLKLASAAAAGKSSGSDNQTEPFAGRKVLFCETKSHLNGATIYPRVILTRTTNQIAFRNLLKPRKRSRPPRHHALALGVCVCVCVCANSTASKAFITRVCIIVIPRNAADTTTPSVGASRAACVDQLKEYGHVRAPHPYLC